VASFLRQSEAALLIHSPGACCLKMSSDSRALKTLNRPGSLSLAAAASWDVVLGPVKRRSAMLALVAT
jgi:hypothetical protein